MKRSIRILVILFAVILLVAMTPHAQTTQVQLNFTWNANSEPDLAGYRLWYGSESRNYSDVVDVGNVTEHSMIFDMADNITLYFALTAVDTSDNESPFSNEVSYTYIPLDTEPPGAPTGLTFVEIRISTQ